MRDNRKLWLVTATVEHEVQAYVLAETEAEAEKGYTFRDLQGEDSIDEHDMTSMAVEADDRHPIADGWSNDCVAYGNNENEEKLGDWIEKTRLRRLEAEDDAKQEPLFKEGDR